MSYALPADIIARYDARILGDLVQDAGTRVSAAALQTDSNLQATLDDASGMIDAALLRGGRYLPTDLTGLPTTGNSIKLLRRVTSDLAYGLLLGRRNLPAPQQVTDARAMLEALSEGQWVFADVPAALTAGKPQNVQLDSNIALISSIDRIFGNQQVGNDPTNNFRT